MKNIKNELQNIILGNESAGNSESVKRIQVFLRRYAQTSSVTSKEKYFKNQEEAALSEFLKNEGLFYTHPVAEENYLTEGAEQKVYRFDEQFIIKLNDGIFYEPWFDYFNSLLIHNYFLSSTPYEFLGFAIRSHKYYAVVKQRFIPATEMVDLNFIAKFLESNRFLRIRNNDYINKELGLIFEDLHDENVISNNGILYFVDTIFYLTEEFYNP